MSNFLTTEQWQEFCNLSNDSIRDFNFSGTPWTKLEIISVIKVINKELL